jgi:pilus assembly protein Flp/PilA
MRLNRRGQGNTEFIVVVALIAIATIGVVTLFGDNLRHLFGYSADGLGGDETTNGHAHSSSVATEKTMGTFAQSNAYDPLPNKNTPPGWGGSGSSSAP